MPSSMPHLNTMANWQGVWRQQAGECWIGFADHSIEHPEWNKWVIICSQGTVYASHVALGHLPNTQWETDAWITEDGHGVAGASPPPTGEHTVPTGMYVHHMSCEHV